MPSDNKGVDFSKLKNKPQPIDMGVFADDAETRGNATGTGGYSIDFSTVPDTDKPIPPGKYNATIVHAEPKTSKAGNPMIAIRWRIDDEGEYYHRNIFDNLVFSQNALWRVRQVLLAVGFSTTFNGDVNPESLLGESATLTVTIQAGKGINEETGEPYPPRNSISKVEPIGNSAKVADLL